MQYIEKMHQDHLGIVQDLTLRERHYGRIKITSGEQFVPLYLTLITTCPTPLRYHYFPNGTRKAFIKEVQPGQGIKEPLRDLLTTFVPTEYTFVRPVKTCENAGESYKQVFLGRGVPQYPYRNGSSWISTLGLWATYTEAQGMMLKSTHYLSYNYPRQFEFTPQILVVIKAKHLAYVRACKLLSAPMCKLPYSDIKVLRITNLDSTGIELFSLLKNDFSDINIEITDVTTIKNLLMEIPTRQTRDQWLGNAKMILKNPKLQVQECVV